MNDELREALDSLCEAAWETSEHTLNSGGCAGFAAIAASVVAKVAPAYSPRCTVCLPYWSNPDVFRIEWRLRKENPQTLQVWHVVCSITSDDQTLVVDAEHGVMGLEDYAYKRPELVLVEDIAIPPVYAWNAYKVRHLWNSTFKRTSMRRIRDAARARFGRFSIARD
jgi:hypothetical protein